MIKKLRIILNKKEKRQIPFILIEIVIGSILETIGISAILPVVNILVDPDVVHENGVISALYKIVNCQSVNQFVIVLMFLVAAFYIIKNIFLFFMHYHQYYFINKGQRTLTNRLMKDYFAQPYLYFTKKNIADLQRNVANDIGKCYQTILSIIMMMTQGSITIALIIFLLVTDWLTSLIVLGLSLISIFIFMKIAQNKLHKYGLIARMNGAQIIQWINQSISGIKEVKLFNREEYFIEKIDQAYSKSALAECKTNVISSMPTLMMETICIVVILMASIIEISIGGDLQNFVTTLVAFALVAIRLVPNISGFSSRLNMVTFNAASIDGIYKELIELEMSTSWSTDVKQSEYHKKMLFTDKLIVENLTFRYPDSKEEVFHNINLQIKRGESVALVGPSGAGKTTLVDILIGLLGFKEGDIKVDGVSINTDIHSWYNQIGYIPQNIYLMDDTIRNNIAFGIPPEDIDDEKVWEALRKAQMEKFIKKLPKELDANLGDRGIRCSGGQRQRLGIARALYDDPEFLILDEATSALDNDTEKAIMEAIDGLKGKKTLLIIAHRLSTIKNCDAIYRVENQKIRKEK